MSGTTGAQPWQLPDLTVPQMRGMLAFLHGWDEDAFGLALEAVRRTPAGALPGQAAPLDSESWTCGGCHGTFIGHRPAGDRCGACQPAADGYLSPPDVPCPCPGVHYARVARAWRLGWISGPDFAQAIHDADLFSGTTVLLDPGEVAP